jgi:hypothetical protein
MGDAQKLPSLKQTDYSWGAEAQKTTPKKAVQTQKVVPTLKAAAQTKETRINRIFDAEGDAERLGAVNELVSAAKPKPRFTERKTFDYKTRAYKTEWPRVGYGPGSKQDLQDFDNKKKDIVANILSVIKNIDPNEKENLRTLFLEYFEANSITKSSMEKFSSACASAYKTANGSSISSYNIWIAGGKLSGVTTPSPSSLDSARISALKPKPKQGQQPGNEPVMIKIDEASASDDSTGLANILAGVVLAKNSLGDMIGDDMGTLIQYSRDIQGKKTDITLSPNQAYDNVESAFIKLIDCIKKGVAEEINVNTLNKRMQTFLNQLNEYITVSNLAYANYEKAHPESRLEGALSGPMIVPMIFGLVYAKNRTLVEKQMLSRLEKGIGKSIYKSLASKEIEVSLGQKMARFGVGTAMPVAVTGFVGGSMKYGLDSWVYDGRTGSMRDFLKSQRNGIKEMKAELGKLKEQNDKNPAMLELIDSATGKVNEADAELARNEKKAKKGAPSFGVDLLEVTAAVIALGILTPRGWELLNKRHVQRTKWNQATEEVEKIAAKAKTALKSGTPAKQKAVKEELQDALEKRNRFLPEGKKATKAEGTLDELVGKLDKEARDKEINAAIGDLNKALKQEDPKKIAAARLKAEDVVGEGKTGTEKLQDLIKKASKKRRT